MPTNLVAGHPPHGKGVAVVGENGEAVVVDKDCAAVGTVVIRQVEAGRVGLGQETAGIAN